MDSKRKQKPSIVITTYSSAIHSKNDSSHHSPLSANGGNSSRSGSQSVIESTNLFSMNYEQLASNNFHASFQSQNNPTLSPANLPQLNQIKGPGGSVRGHKDVVKKSLENIKSAASSGQRNFSSSNLPTFMPASQTNNQAIQHMDEFYRIEYLNELIRGEENLCVVYTTTLGVIRRTFEDSKLMR